MCWLNEEREVIFVGIGLYLVIVELYIFVLKCYLCNCIKIKKWYNMIFSISIWEIVYIGIYDIINFL